MRNLIAILMVTLFCFNASVLAEQLEWRHCDLTRDVDFLPYVAPSDNELVDVQADSAQFVNAGTSVFSGNVIVTRGGRELTADRATYDRASGTVTAQNKMRLRDSEIVLDADQAEWSMSNDEGALIGAEYHLRQNHARGQAGHVLKQGAAVTGLSNASYTTCADGDNFWDLEASNINLDHNEGVGTARDVVIHIKDVPVFYTPYISFPLNDDRKSGFLAASFGSSSETGIDLQTPYYWNIAPGRDATLTPRYMSERGLQLNGEYRYLYDQGYGEITAGFLASDDLQNRGEDANPFFGQDRQHFSFRHTSDFKSRWSTDIDYNYVSDNAYLEDFGSNLTLASTTHLNRLFNLRYGDDNWLFTGRLQGYQTIVDAEKPYQRLPQLLLEGSFPEQAFGLSYGLRTEYTDFDHKDLVDGQRFDIEPSVSLPLQSASAFFTPRMALKHTQYSLNENAATITDDSPSRTLPIASVDSGLFFERDLTFSGGEYIQTLEPRAFYLYVPERSQVDIPVFDSNLRTFNFGQLFAYDRFSGIDRVGDANQLSLAITSRVLDAQTGREKFSASLGQIKYFRDRDVTLINGLNDTRSGSDFVAEVSAEVAENWTARGEMQWGQNWDMSNFSAMQLRYRDDNGKILNVAHRYRRDEISTLEGLEQIDISGRLPINKHWSVVGRYYHSIRDGELLEGLVGVEYESCCWSTRLVIRDFINDINNANNNNLNNNNLNNNINNTNENDRNLAILLQIELKGLGNFGQKTDSLLEQSIFGFDAD